MNSYGAATGRSSRFKTREVFIGQVGVGGSHPIRIQSMTTTDTRQIDLTIDQIMKLADMGCEIVRITVQGMKEADACEGIKSGLIQRGYTIPLVADIHFFPQAAMRVVDFVEKVRINPGNFVDRRATFKTLVYDDQTYASEIAKIDEKFTPLVEKCKKLKRAMRIGTNHGSLSDRILNRFGDTPQGMVESALEFARVARKNDFHDLIFSMKASNPLVMIQAYRLLNQAMIELGWNYPLHLGVTEAGEGEDGRIKSAVGIGALLLDGLGDTIRVSLTEDPWYEIDPCRRLVQFATDYRQRKEVPFAEKHRHIQAIAKREVILHDFLHRDGSVALSLPAKEPSNLQLMPAKKLAPDFIVATGDQKIAAERVKKGEKVVSQQPLKGAIPLRDLSQLFAEDSPSNEAFTSYPYRPQEKASQEKAPYALLIQDEPEEMWEVIKKKMPAFILLNPKLHSRLHYARHFFDWLKEENLALPVILAFDYNCSAEDLIVHAAAECGALLADKLGEGVCLSGPYDSELLKNLSFSLLQAVRMRSSKTDFISCPSCGRTLFDLQTVSKKIRERTAHLPGVKIAIMGCIVNGPGEMADADFGYVGTKPGKIDLYVGKECVERDIDHSAAVERLVELLKKHGRWIEPSLD